MSTVKNATKLEINKREGSLDQEKDGHKYRKWEEGKDE